MSNHAVPQLTICSLAAPPSRGESVGCAVGFGGASGLGADPNPTRSGDGHANRCANTPLWEATP